MLSLVLHKLMVFVHLPQHWFEAEPTKVCDTPQHNESKIEGHKEIYSAGSESRSKIWLGGCWSYRTPKEKSRGSRFFSGRTNWQAKKWGPCHLITARLRELSTALGSTEQWHGLISNLLGGITTISTFNFWRNLSCTEHLLESYRLPTSQARLCYINYHTVKFIPNTIIL